MQVERSTNGLETSGLGPALLAARLPHLLQQQQQLSLKQLSSSDTSHSHAVHGLETVPGCQPTSCASDTNSLQDVQVSCNQGVSRPLLSSVASRQLTGEAPRWHKSTGEGSQCKRNLGCCPADTAEQHPNLHLHLLFLLGG